MNISRFGRIICISCLILVLTITTLGISYAATTSELKQQQNEIDKKIDELNSELAGTKSKMTQNLNEINKLNSEISTYENQITDLEGRIDIVNAQIAEKETNLAEQQEKYEQQKELLDARLVAMYENGETSYLDMLLSSDGLTDFISNYYMISQLAEFDEELLQGIVNTQNQIQAEKDYLVSAQNEIQETQNTIKSKQTSLATSRNQKKEVVSQLSEEEKELQEQLEIYEEHKKEIQSEIAKQSAQYSTVNVVPSAAGFISPLYGKTKANITTAYGGAGGYSGHTGVDFACAAGTPVLAAKAGKVYKSTAAIRNGVYVSYGEYIIIDHQDGTMSLYAHMLSGSRLVQSGQVVAQGQQIGKVGSTGNSSGNHLHFEVWVNGKHTNPAPFLP